jgi:hypothetical protein
MSRQIERSIVKAATQRRPNEAEEWARASLIGIPVFSLLYLLLQLV